MRAAFELAGIGCLFIAIVCYASGAHGAALFFGFGCVAANALADEAARRE